MMSIITTLGKRSSKAAIKALIAFITPSEVPSSPKNNENYLLMKTFNRCFVEIMYLERKQTARSIAFKTNKIVYNIFPTSAIGSSSVYKNELTNPK